MPGSTPPTSQLDWLSSTTAMIVLSWSKATRDLLKSFSWGIGALRQLFASDDGAISSPPAPYHLSAGGSRIRTLGPSRERAALPGAQVPETSRLPTPNCRSSHRLGALVRLPSANTATKSIRGHKTRSTDQRFPGDR